MSAMQARRALRGSGIDHVTRWGVVEHWALNEASGAAVASISAANNLTDNNTVTNAAGKVYATARQFTAANSESLTLVDNEAMSTGDVDFWLAAWFYIDANSGAMVIASKTAGSQNEWNSYVQATASGGTVRSEILNPAGSSLGAIVVGPAPSETAWHMIVFYHDSVNNVVGASLDGAAFSTQATAGAPTNGTGLFRIGATGGSFFNGRIGPVVFGKSPPLGIAALATEIRDRLYNGGNGRAYPWR